MFPTFVLLSRLLILPLNVHEVQSVTADHRVKKGANGNSKSTLDVTLAWKQREAGHPQRTTDRDESLQAPGGLPCSALKMGMSYVSLLNSI